MSVSIPDDLKVRPCVGSGLCCKIAPCLFGERAEDSSQCIFLEEIEQPDGRHPRYTCGKYDEIVSQPGWEMYPAFGAGCCSAMFNPDREAIIRDIIRDRDASSGSVDVALGRHHRKHDER